MRSNEDIDEQVWRENDNGSEAKDDHGNDSPLVRLSRSQLQRPQYHPPSHNDQRRDAVSIIDTNSDMCELTSQLTTTMQADSTISGAMFTVQSLDDFLDIVTLEFSVNPIDNSNVHVQVFTKIGDFIGFEDKPNLWSQVANATMQPSQYGLGTIIPVASFASISMQPRELRSFYIALETPLLECTKAPKGMSVGYPVQANKFLSVSVGTGLPRYFGARSIIKDRIFNGRVHYTTKLKCNDALVPTTVVYSFLIEQQISAADSELLSKLQTTIESSLSGIFQSADASFQPYVQQGRLAIASVQASPAAYTGSCPWSACSLVSSVVTLEHLDLIDSGMLVYDMMQNNVTLTESLHSSLGVTVQYAGNITVSQAFVFTLKGVPENATLDTVQTSYFEQATLQFLQQAAMGLTTKIMLDVKVSGQSSPTRYLRRERELQSSSSSSSGPTSVLQLTGEILGMYVPPQDLPYFGEFIQGLFSDNVPQYVQHLSYGSGGPGPIAEAGRGTLFAQLFGISTAPTQGSGQGGGGGSGTKPTEGTSKAGSKKLFGGNMASLGILIGCVVIICIMILWIIYHFAGGKPAQLRKKKRLAEDPTLSKRRLSRTLTRGKSLRELIRTKTSRRLRRSESILVIDIENKGASVEKNQGNKPGEMGGPKGSTTSDNEGDKRTSAVSKTNAAGDKNVVSPLSGDSPRASTKRRPSGDQARLSRGERESEHTRSRSRSFDKSQEAGRMSTSSLRRESASSVTPADAKSPEATDKLPATSNSHDGNNLTAKKRASKTESMCQDPSERAKPDARKSMTKEEMSAQAREVRKLTDSSGRSTRRGSEQPPTGGLRRSVSEGAENAGMVGTRPRSNSTDRQVVSAKVSNESERKLEGTGKPLLSRDSVNSSIRVAEGSETPRKREADPESSRSADKRSQLELLRERSCSLPPKSRRNSGDRLVVPTDLVNAVGQVTDGSERSGTRRRSLNDTSRERSGSVPHRGRSKERSKSVSSSSSGERAQVSSNPVQHDGDNKERSSKKEADQEKSNDRRASLNSTLQKRSASVPPRGRTIEKSASSRPRSNSNDRLEVSLDKVKSNGQESGSNEKLSKQETEQASNESARRRSTGGYSRERSGSLTLRRSSTEISGSLLPRRASNDKLEISGSSRLFKDETNKNTSTRLLNSTGADRRVSTSATSSPASSDAKEPRSHIKSDVHPEKKASQVDQKARFQQNKRARLKRAGLIQS